MAKAYRTSSLKPKIDTIEKARREIRDYWLDGCLCPCCGKRVSLDKRPIYKTMCAQLIALYHLPDGFHHNREFKGYEASAGDFHKLRYWDMIEPEANDNPKKRNSGRWRITQKGRDFVEERIQVPSAAFVYNHKVRYFSDDLVGIRERLHGKDGNPPPEFDYTKLMNFLI